MDWEHFLAQSVVLMALRDVLSDSLAPQCHVVHVSVLLLCLTPDLRPVSSCVEDAL